MIRRTMDSALLNRVINDPSVRPHVVADDGIVDVTTVVQNPDNYALVTEHGGFILIRHEPGVYEVHSQFLPEGRGKHAVAAMREGFRYMFANTDCLEIVTKVCDDNLPADSFAKIAGFKHRFSRENAWNGKRMSYRAITIDDWAMTDPVARKAGQDFHERLEAEKVRRGSVLPVHDEDQVHDRYVGAAYLLFQHQPTKAVWFYNKWARFSGYATIELLSDRPTVVDVRDAIIELGDDLNFLSVRIG